jgi:ubiquinol-cytochrome c reductase subunit 6
MVAVKEKCGQSKECSALMEKLTTCNDRVNSKSNTAETCVEELTDYLHCVDHCVSISPKNLHFCFVCKI